MSLSNVILLVEDEPLIAMEVASALTDAGFEVLEARTGEGALATLEADGATLRGLVTDVRLGSITGWDVARRAREMVAAIPVVFVSGDSAHEHTSHGVPDSIMIQKPFVSAQIVVALATLMNAS